MHNSFIKAIASSCSCEFDTDWHERKMFKFVIPFLFKRLWEKRVCPKASGDTAMLWSIRVCDGFCIDHENVGWWSGLEGAVGWRWGGGGGLSLGFLWWLPHYTDVAKIHSNLSAVVIVLIIPDEVIVALGFLHPASFGIHSSHSVIGEKRCGK